MVDAACLSVPAEAVWASWVAAGVVIVILGGAAGGAAAAVLGLVVVTVAPVVVLRAGGDRRDRAVERGLPDALDAVARSLRSGAGLHRALTEAAAGPGPVADELRSVVAEVDAGDGLLAALDGWAARRPLPGVRLAVAALAVGLETGGAQARAVDGVAATIRAHQALAGEVRALSSQARASAVVIALAPVGFAALAAATDPRTATFLLRTPAGLACLSLGLALDAAAAAWMHRLTAVEL